MVGFASPTPSPQSLAPTYLLPFSVAVVRRFFENSFTAALDTVRTRGVSEASSSTASVRLRPAHFSAQTPTPSCQFNPILRAQRR